jgi:dCTP deaminase
MAVLGNRAIVEALDSGRLLIEPRPEPGPGNAGTPYNTSSVDLCLADEILVPKDGLSLNFDLRTGSIAETLRRLSDRRIIPADGWILQPRSFVLGRTIERIALPLEGRLAARIEGRSSFARTGLLVHFTAPTIHANFSGTITLEMINLGPLPLVLTPGLRVCQLIVETVEGHVVPEPSQFQGQRSASGTPKVRGRRPPR